MSLVAILILAGAVLASAAFADQDVQKPVSFALKAGVTQVVFDRSGYIYTGRVASLADGAREAGLKF